MGYWKAEFVVFAYVHLPLMRKERRGEIHAFLF